MDAYGCIEIRMRFRELQNIGKILEIDADAQGVCYGVGLHQRQNIVDAFGEFRKIQMAMRIDKHQRPEVSVRSSAP